MLPAASYRNQVGAGGRSPLYRPSCAGNGAETTDKGCFSRFGGCVVRREVSCKLGEKEEYVRGIVSGEDQEDVMM
jgi:hypothetical protein